MNWNDLERRYLFQNYARQPVLLVRGEGTRAWDESGKEYLDLVGGLGVNLLGHPHKDAEGTLAAQAATLIHTSNVFSTVPAIALARLLVEHSCLDRVLFVNSGAESVEAALKLARVWNYATGRGAHEIVSTEGGFHGRTMGALSATGHTAYREPFEPLVPGFVHVPWNDAHALKTAVTTRTAAVLLEPIQGERGVNVPDPGYLRLARDVCDQTGALLILDEIQTGLARTGYMWAHEHDGISPDIMCVAKGLAGGLPIGAVLAREDVALAMGAGQHGTTLGGNPLVTTVAEAHFRRLVEEDAPAMARSAHAQFAARLPDLKRRFPAIIDVRGRGLLIGIQLADASAARITDEARDRGLLVNAAERSRRSTCGTVGSGKHALVAGSALDGGAAIRAIRTAGCRSRYSGGPSDWARRPREAHRRCHNLMRRRPTPQLCGGPRDACPHRARE